MKFTNNKFLLPLLACFTLGLAPFTPEPHIWGKLKWLAGGGIGMQGADYIDVLMHGAPWLWLIFELSKLIFSKPKA